MDQVVEHLLSRCKALNSNPIPVAAEKLSVRPHVIISCVLNHRVIC
jgi:hypothetical protein